MFRISSLFRFFRKKEAIKTPIEPYDIAGNIPKLDVIKEVDTSEIIGQTIVGISYRYELLGWVDYFETFLTLSNGQTISLPFPNSEKVLVIEKPNNTRQFSKEFACKIVGQNILSFPEEDEDDDFFGDYSSFLQLENGYYIRERTMNPHGTGLADLYLVSSEDFFRKKKT